MRCLEHLLETKGLRRIGRLIDIAHSGSFIVDSIGKDNQPDLEFPVYPTIREKLNLTHNLLSLYGVHWSYYVNNSDWTKIRVQEGDSEKIIDSIEKGLKIERRARYAFTQNNVDRHQSLWIFVRNTEGWEYYQDVLLPKFKEDMSQYQKLKKSDKTQALF